MPKNREIEFEDADDMTFSDPINGTATKSRDGTSMQDSSLKSMHSSKISNEDFENLKVIGRGSFGKVYLVRKKDT